MKICWIISCLLVLSGCKSGSTAPVEEESLPAAEPATPVEEATSTVEQEPAAEQPSAPDAPTPAEVAEPVFALDPNAPADVAAPPARAKRTKSGLASTVLKKGTGRDHPGKFDTVTLSYTGWTPDGRIFDSSLSHGQTMQVPLNHLIHGFAEGLQLMVAGEKRRLWIPGNLAYGEKGEAEQEAPRQLLGGTAAAPFIYTLF